jgi:D-arginine dehydrogenase
MFVAANTPSPVTADVIVIGAGIAGASVAWHLRGKARVILLEREAHPGYHTTGRSAAFYAQTYGGADVQPLSFASKSFLFAPPAGFSAVPLVSPRGALYTAVPDQVQLLDRMYAQHRTLAPSLRFLSVSERMALAPMIRAPWHAAALYDPECQDMDVAAIHAGFLRGQDVRTSAQIERIEKTTAGWQLTTTAGIFAADILVNAAGAWGDEVAILAGVAPLGLEPRRRTILAFTPETSKADPAAPLVLDAAETFYFKPDGQDIWASPADETLSPPCDSQPDEMDIAITIDRIERATSYKVKSIKRKWSGLRTFTPDRLPAFGYDPVAPNFFWCVGQGGWGIQTAPAAGQLCAALILNDALPANITDVGITAKRYAPRSAGQD